MHTRTYTCKYNTLTMCLSPWWCVCHHGDVFITMVMVTYLLGGGWFRDLLKNGFQHTSSGSWKLAKYRHQSIMIGLKWNITLMYQHCTITDAMLYLIRGFDGSHSRFCSYVLPFSSSPLLLHTQPFLGQGLAKVLRNSRRLDVFDQGEMVHHLSARKLLKLLKGYHLAQV